MRLHLITRFGCRADSHMGVANSFALKVAGISNITKDPVGGTILKTADGEPTGLVVDSAMKLVFGAIPEVSINERRDALIRASKYALTKGVTMVIDVGRYFPCASIDQSRQDLSDIYMLADSAGKMLIRACIFFPMQTWSRLADGGGWFQKSSSLPPSPDDEDSAGTSSC